LGRWRQTPSIPHQRQLLGNYRENAAGDKAAASISGRPNRAAASQTADKTEGKKKNRRMTVTPRILEQSNRARHRRIEEKSTGTPSSNASKKSARFNPSISMLVNNS
jgi:hypothetical protein